MEILQSDLYYSTHVLEKMHTNVAWHKKLFLFCFHLTFLPLTALLIILLVWFEHTVRWLQHQHFHLFLSPVCMWKGTNSLQFTGEGEATIWCCCSCLAILGSPPDLHTERICLCVDAQQWELLKHLHSLPFVWLWCSTSCYLDNPLNTTFLLIFSRLALRTRPHRCFTHVQESKWLLYAFTVHETVFHWLNIAILLQHFLISRLLPHQNLGPTVPTMQPAH